MKQALASLAAFIGSVNYSESFHMVSCRSGLSEGAAIRTTATRSGGVGAMSGQLRR